MHTPALFRFRFPSHPVFKRLFQCLALQIVVSASLEAATIGYWRFEENAFLADSSGNGYALTTPGSFGSPAQYALPATGIGSNFPSSVGGHANGHAVQGAGANNTFQNRQLSTNIGAPGTNLDKELTIEAFFNLSYSSASSSSVIASQGAGATSGASWGLTVTSGGSSVGGRNLVFQYNKTGGTWGTDLALIDTDIVIELDKDYYVAFTIDFADVTSAGVTVYLKNLTDDTELQVLNLTHSSNFTTMAKTSAPLTIGTGNDGTLPFYGVIDEVRLSDTKLGYNDLLIAAMIPEPSTYAFLAGAAATLLVVRRRR